jgi:PAS domain S-box-containing protein
MSDVLISQNRARGDEAFEVIEQLPVAYFEMNAMGNIVRVNQIACRQLQMERDTILGMSPWEFMASDEIEMSRGEFFEMMISDCDPEPVRRTFYTRSGLSRTYDLYRSRIFDPKGRPAGLRHAAIDITEAQIAHEQTREARVWLESVLESIGESVIVTDGLGMVRYLNPAAEHLLGWKSWELIGKAIEKGMPVLASGSGDHSVPNYSMALDKPWKGVVAVLNRERKQLTVDLSTSPILDRENSITTGVVTILRKVEEPAEPAAR